MAQIVITEFMDEAAVQSLRLEHDVVYEPDLFEDRDRLTAAVARAAALIVRNKTIVDAQLVASAPDLVVVGRLGVGLDNIDLDACAAAGVEVKPATGANAIAVAEYVIGSLLHLLRGVVTATSRLLDGEWPRQELTGREAAGRVLGLVGFGHIAREVATRATALGMEVVATDPYLPDGDPVWRLVGRASLDEFLPRADAVSIHVPLNDETRSLFDAERLYQMKPGAILINTSRGGIVDEKALANALRSGTLGGAALDVFEEEPLSPASIDTFRGIGPLVLTPHIAGITEEAGSKVGSVTADNVRRVFAERGIR